MTPSYQLTKYQFDALVLLAQDDTKVVILPEMNEDDDASLIKRIKTQASEMHDLAFLGLVEDLTAKLADVIMAERMKNGRGYEAFKATEIGSIMFRKKSFKIN